MLKLKTATVKARVGMNSEKLLLNKKRRLVEDELVGLQGVQFLIDTVTGKYISFVKRDMTSTACKPLYKCLQFFSF